ncbi:MAG: MerR family transcriptional regulator [Calditrichaeota bacterium]|nr:MAG: MerR family transcriptional regulator [Calditrichota bacterium]
MRKSWMWILKNAEPKFFKIGQVARQLNIAVETIRMYEREGLLIPEKTKSGQRLFNHEDIHWISCIRRLVKDEGLNLEGIRRLLALLPCWEIRPCTQQEWSQCPAYFGATRPCWTIKSEIPLSCRAENCRECPVYQSASKCDQLKSLLFRLKHHQSLDLKTTVKIS